MEYTIDKVKIKNSDIAYLKFGNGKKRFVIIPGLSIFSVIDSAEEIVKAYEIFAEDYTVYLFDRKEKIEKGYSVAQMAEDTYEAIRELDLSDIYLFGASQGGMIALAMALVHPGLVNKLVIGSSCARVTKESFNTIEGWIRKAKEKDGKALYMDFTEKLYPQGLFNEYAEFFKGLGEKITADDFERFIILARATESFDILDKIKAIKCPLLAIASSDDKVIGLDGSLEISKEMEGNDSFSLYIYDGYGHAAFDTAPDYKERILRFFNN